MRKHNKLLVTLAVSMALSGTHLAAEEATDEEESNVIIVTAQKRSERITEVPIAISVFATEAIEQSGIQELREIGDFIPNMTVTQGTDFNSRILIRGVGAPSRNIGFDSRVGVYLDGVYLGQGPSVNQDLVDLERVEVLRGPQGTLFGKNTVAGAVSLISKKPSGEFEGKGVINVGNFNALEIQGSVDFALSDEISAKIAVSSRTRDGYIKNTYTGDDVPTTINTVAEGVPITIPAPFPLTTNTPPDTTDDINNQDTKSFRAQLRIQPSDLVDINIAIDGLSSERSPALGVELTTAFGDTPSPLANNPREVNWSFQGIEARDIFGANVNVDYDMGNDFTLRSITAYRSTKIHYGNDTDYSPLDFLYLSYDDEYKQTTQEFQLISPDADDFKYVVGLYIYSQDATTVRDAIGGNAAGFFGVPPGGGAFIDGAVKTDSYAAFISGSWDFATDFRLGFGGRYSSETKDVRFNLDGSRSGAFATGCSGQTSCLNGASTDYLDDETYTHFSPTVSLNYAVSEATNTYAKVSTGFKSGGYNLDYITQPQINDPENNVKFTKETVVSFELGLKTSFFDERLSLNTAYFNATYDDYQVNQFVNLGFDEATGTQLTAIQIKNAAQVDTSGFEFEAVYRVTDELTINASLGLLDATFADFPGGTTEIITAGDITAEETASGLAPGATRGINAKGKKLPLAADMSASLSIQYYANLDSMGTDLLFRLDASHSSDYFTTTENVKTRDIPGTHPLTFVLGYPELGQTNTVEFGHVDAVTTLNGRIGLIDQEGYWEVYLWGRNLTDEQGSVDSFREFFGTLVSTPRQPRTYGVEVTYSF